MIIYGINVSSYSGQDVFQHRDCPLFGVCISFTLVGSWM